MKLKINNTISKVDLNSILINIYVFSFFISVLHWQSIFGQSKIVFGYNYLVILIQLSVIGVLTFYSKVFDEIKVKINSKAFILLLMYTVSALLTTILNITTSNFTTMFLFVFLACTFPFIYLIVRQAKTIQTNLVKNLSRFVIIAAVYSVVIYLFNNNSYFHEHLVFQSINVFSLNFSQIMMGKTFVRVSSFFSNPNQFGTTIAVIYIIYLVAKESLGDIFKSRKIEIVFYISVVISLLLSNSRGAILIAGLFTIGRLAYMVDFSKIKTKYKILGFVSFSIVLLVIVYFIFFSRGSLFSSSNRMDSWIESFDFIKSNFFFGRGSSSLNEFLLSKKLSTTHNLYISILGDFGIVGLFIVVYIFLLPFLLFYKYKISLKSNRKIYEGLLIISIFIVHQNFENLLFQFNFYSMFVMFVYLSLLDEISSYKLNSSNVFTIHHFLSSSKYSGAENVVITMIKHYSSKFKGIYSSKDGEIRNYLINDGIDFKPISNVTPFTMKSVIDIDRVAILHAHDFKASVASALCGFQLPIISHIHSNPKWIKKINMKTIIYNFSCLFFDEIFVVSKEVIEGSKILKINKNKMKVVSNPLDIEKIDLMSKELNDNHFDVLFVGRLTKDKNPEMILQIFKGLIHEERGIKIGVVGDGPYSVDMKSIAKEYPKNINTFGFQKNPYKFIANTKVMVMPSLYEGFGLVACESMYLGKPVVVSRAGALPSIVNNDYLVCDTLDEYVSVIIQLLKDDEKYAIISDDIRETIDINFSMPNYMNNIENSYMEMISK